MVLSLMERKSSIPVPPASSLPTPCQHINIFEMEGSIDFKGMIDEIFSKKIVTLTLKINEPDWIFDDVDELTQVSCNSVATVVA